MQCIYPLLILLLLFMLPLNEWFKILIQKYEKSLGFGLGLDNKVLFTSLSRAPWPLFSWAKEATCAA